MSASDTNVFVILREQVSLAEEVGKYTDLVRVGGSFKGRCPHPEHEDGTPSFHVYPDGHFHCFGCGWHGDVTDLRRIMDGTTSAYEAAVSVAREHGIQLPQTSESIRERMEERREKARLIFARATRAHEALNEHPDVGRWWEDRGFGAECQKRFLLGEDRGAATIPLWHRGEVHGLVRRRLTGEPKYELPRKEDLLDRHRPLFVPGSLGERVLVVEGYVDALALCSLGLSAAAVGGTHMNAVQLDSLRDLGERGTEIYVLPDDDEAGAKAGMKWVTDLYPYARLCSPRYGIDLEDTNL